MRSMVGDFVEYIVVHVVPTFDSLTCCLGWTIDGMWRMIVVDVWSFLAIDQMCRVNLVRFLHISGIRIVFALLLHDVIILFEIQD